MTPTIDVETSCAEDPPPPIVKIRVRVAACAAAGQELEYRICLENVSEVPAHHVHVRNPLPTNARFVRATPEPMVREPELIWQLGTLEACACREIVLVLQPTGTDDVKNCARVQFEHGQCVCTKITRPSMSLRKNGPANAVLNDTLSYQLTVTNTGGTPLSNVSLTDPLPLGLEHSSGRRELSWDIGTLAPGDCKNVDYQVVAKAAGRHCNRAVAVAAGGMREEAESCVVVGEAKLALKKTGPGERYMSLPATYQITVSNAGTVPLRDVVVTDPLPAQTTFVSASNGGQMTPSRNGSVVRWTIGVLDAGASRTVDVEVRARSAGRICNRATATADHGLTANAEACTDFIGASALLLEVVDIDDPVEVGAETSYTIVVVNQGMVPATNVVVDALAPDEMAVSRVTGPSDNRKEGQRVIFSPMTIPSKSDARFTVYVKALKPGDVRFKVTLKADQLPSGPVHEEESTNIYLDLPTSQLKQGAGNQTSRPSR